MATAPDHGAIPQGDGAAHPLGYVQPTSPGAIGAFRPWMDTSAAADGFFTPKIRNAGNTDYLTPPYATAAAVAGINTRVVALEAVSPTLSTVALSVQFGDGVTADAAGAVRIVRTPVGLTPVGWISDADAACTATFTVEKSPAGSVSWSSLVGAGTAPALSAANYAGDTDGAVDWSGGAVAQYGGIKITLATYTAGSSKRVGLTIIFARVV